MELAPVKCVVDNKCWILKLTKREMVERNSVKLRTKDTRETNESIHIDFGLHLGPLTKTLEYS